MRRTWIAMPVLYLLAVAVFGVVLRGFVLYSMPAAVHYDYILHAHSHLAILGWGYTAMFLLFLHYFGAGKGRKDRPLSVLFWSTQATVIAMTAAFAVQGYALFSILFSSLHIFLSYWFILYCRKSWKARAASMPAASLRFAKASLFFLFFSSFGPWALAVLGANHLSDTPYFYMAVYSYLHFQYNGWFTLGLMALLYAVLEKYNIPFSAKKARFQHGLYFLSLFPACLLSLLGFHLGATAHWIAFAGGVMQWVAIVSFCRTILSVRREFGRVFRGIAGAVAAFALFCLLAKTTLEMLSAIPAIVTLIESSRSLVIGYLHLALVGFVSFLCLAFFLQLGWMPQRSATVRPGVIVLSAGFILNELLLFIQGLFDWLQAGAVPWGGDGLLAAALLMLAGIGLLAASGLTAARHRSTAVTYASNALTRPSRG